MKGFLEKTKTKYYEFKIYLKKSAQKMPGSHQLTRSIDYYSSFPLDEMYNQIPSLFPLFPV